MNFDNLLDKISIRSKGPGNYRVSILYRNKWYSVTSNNSLAFDRIHNSHLYRDRQSVYGYTLKQAFLSFYDEVKRGWNL